MRSFQYFVPTEVCFGTESIKQLPVLIKKHGGSRVLVVYGGGSAKKSGLLDQVCSLLEQAEISFALFGGVQPNPRAELAREGVKQSLAMQADLILAVGGGSVIDTCKAIAHGSATPEIDIWQYWEKTEVVKKTLPVGVVLTIPAAGSETSDSAVLTNVAEDKKRGLTTDFNRPAFAVMDPSLAATLPKRQVACGVTDIMMHTLDRYFNPYTDNETTDEIAEAILRVVIRHGPAVCEDPSNVEAMSEIMWCGSLSHNGLSGLGGKMDFAPHQFGHGLSEKFDTYHGESLSTVWASWARYVYQTDVARFARYAKNVWGIERQTMEESALEGIAVTEQYFRSLGMPTDFTSLGIGVQDEAGLADLALRCSHQKSRTVGTFQKLAYEDMLEIYRAANH